MLKRINDIKNESRGNSLATYSYEQLVWFQHKKIKELIPCENERSNIESKTVYVNICNALNIDFAKINMFIKKLINNTRRDYLYNFVDSENDLIRFIWINHEIGQHRNGMCVKIIELFQFMLTCKQSTTHMCELAVLNHMIYVNGERKLITNEYVAKELYDSFQSFLNNHVFGKDAKMIGIIKKCNSEYMCEFMTPEFNRKKTEI